MSQIHPVPSRPKYRRLPIRLGRDVSATSGVRPKTDVPNTSHAQTSEMQTSTETSARTCWTGRLIDVCGAT